MTTRLLFLNDTRMSDAKIALQYDNNMLNVDKTIIYYGPSDPAFDTFCNFTVKKDVELILKTNHLDDFYKFGGWISQQFLKLLAIHYCDDNEILIQDCDVYLNAPYDFFPNGNPATLIHSDQTEAVEYYEYIEKILSIPRQTTDCFVTEFMPITKNNWLALVDRIENLHQKNWFDAIFDIIDNDYTGNQIWFSEYEFLGNWQLFMNPNLIVNEQKMYCENIWPNV